MLWVERDAMILPDLEISPNTYYTKDEAAAMLRVSRHTIERLLKTGLANGVRVGRQWRILGSDLLQMPRMHRASDDNLTVSLMHLSEPTFARVWDNDEDSVYDAL
jgi:excisionase family DNA binding protein